MSWSPEELVKQLRYPSGYPAEFERQLMRDAADMIERLLAQLANERAILAAVDELGRGMSIGLSRAAEERDAALAELAAATHQYEGARRAWEGEYRDRKTAEAAVARVREVLDDPWRHWNGDASAFIARVRAAIEGNQP